MTRRDLPAGYPATPNAGIADARAFKHAGSNVIHRPIDYPDAVRVIAACGTWGSAYPGNTRPIDWASGYVPADTWCPRCWPGDASS